MRHLTDGPAPFYVLGGFMCRPTPSPWVLGLYDTEAEARRAIAWQDIGQGDAREFRVATYDAGRQRFEIVTGGAVDFPLRRGCYTVAAYAEFMRQHGIDPRHMQETGVAK